METSRCVTTLSSITEKIVDGTFVNVRASFSRTINLISGIANTAIRSQQVLASSVGANIGILGAFVNICSVKSSKFYYPCFILISITFQFQFTVSAVSFARAKWTELFEFFAVRLRTSLARCSPTHRLAKNDGATTAAGFSYQ